MLHTWLIVPKITIPLPAAIRHSTHGFPSLAGAWECKQERATALTVASKGTTQDSYEKKETSMIVHIHYVKPQINKKVGI